MTQANTKYVSVRFRVPRDPSAYRPHDHFLQRAKYRLPDDSERSHVIESCIKHGKVRGATPPEGGELDSVTQRFAFEHDGWTLIVGIRPAAFKEPDTKHVAITIYPEEEDR